MKFIDPHIHLFNLALGQYQWLKPENPPFWPEKNIINNNFTESDLSTFEDESISEPESTTKELKREGFVHIEAGFDNNKPWKEIQWLESHCTSTFRSVACIDLTLSPQNFTDQIQTLLTYKSVVGCRHILDDCARDILNNKNTVTNLKQLTDNQLSFDLQMQLSDVSAINTLCLILKDIPALTVIINHAGFPPYFSDVPSSKNENALYCEYKNWRYGIKMLSQFKQCAIKCSGWEMIERRYTTTWCNHIIEQCVNDFGINRVMLSSNFPLCLFSHTYQEIWQQYTALSNANWPSQLNAQVGEQLGSRLDKQQQRNQLCLENTKHWYKF